MKKHKITFVNNGIRGVEYFFDKQKMDEMIKRFIKKYRFTGYYIVNEEEVKETKNG